MVQKETGKTIALALAAVVLLLSFTPSHIIHDMGLTDCATLRTRLAYTFFHANFIHATLNAWCLLQAVFAYNVTTGRLLTAFLIAVTVPPFVLSDVPTVGLSAMIYALLGMCVFHSQNKGSFLLMLLAFICLGFLTPNVNALIHLWCFTCGLLLGFLQHPFITRTV